jgi:hypothetical protein
MEVRPHDASWKANSLSKQVSIYKQNIAANIGRIWDRELVIFGGEIKDSSRK